jgi:uncharacterized protein (TIGR04145 family)
MKFSTALVALALGLGLAAVTTTHTTHATDFNHATQTASDTGITLDGQYSDWASLPSAKVNYDTAFDHTTIVKIIATTSVIDVYVEAHSANGNYLPYAGWTGTVAGSGIAFQVGSKNQLTTGSNTVYSNSRMAHYGSVFTTQVPADGTYSSAYTRSEFSITPSQAGITSLKNGDTVSLNFEGTGLGSQTISTIVGSGGALSGSGTSAAAPATSSSSSSSSSASSSTSSSTTASSSSSTDLNGAGVIDGKGDTPAKGDSNTSNDNLGIVIDGKFSDWDNITKTDEANGNKMAMVADGDFVYVYVMAGQYYLPQNGYKFTAGGKTFWITPQNGGNGATTPTPKHFTVSGGQWDTSTEFANVGDGYQVQASIDGKQQSLMEYRFKLSDLGLSATTSQTVTLHNDAVGPTTITAAGGSTGPVLLAGVGVLLAGFGYWKARKMGLLKLQPARTSGK